MYPAVVNRVFTWVLPPRILLVTCLHLILGGSIPRMRRMDVTNIYKYPQGEVLLGLDGSLSEVLIGDAAVYAIESLMADRSAAFFICNESVFSLEGARGGHESATWDNGIAKLDASGGGLGGEPQEGILEIFGQALAIPCLTGPHVHCLISMGHRNRQ